MDRFKEYFSIENMIGLIFLWSGKHKKNKKKSWLDFKIFVARGFEMELARFWEITMKNTLEYKVFES